MSDSNFEDCKRCILNESIPGFYIRNNGECSFCKLHDDLEKEYPISKNNKFFKSLIEKIKTSGKNKKYDCVVGVSGGTDSSYTLLMAKKLGLRPLAVHFDNGWNTELSVSNIYIAHFI